MIESGHLNAIVFWFDLHLDEDISITSAPACIGLGGELLADVAGGACSASGREPQQQNPVKARGKSTLQSLGRPQEAALHPPCSYTAGDGHAGHFSPARVCSMACLHPVYIHVLIYREHVVLWLIVKAKVQASSGYS